MKYKMNCIRKKDGSISIFTMFSMLFFLIVVLGIYSLASKNLQSQILSIEQIKNDYYSEDINEVYESIKMNNNI